MPTKFWLENLKGRYLSNDPEWQIMDKVGLIRIGFGDRLL